MKDLFQSFLKSSEYAPLHYQNIENIRINSNFEIKELANADNFSTEVINSVINYLDNSALINVKKSKEQLTMKRITTLSVHVAQLLEYNSDYMIIGGYNGVMMYNIKTMSLSKEITKNNCTDISVSSSGHLFVGYNQKITVYTLNQLNAVVIGEFSGHKKDISKVLALSGDNVASSSADFEIRIWNRNPPFKQLEKLKGHTGRIVSLLELPVKSLLVSGSDDRNLKFLSLHKGYKCINTIPNIKVQKDNAMIELPNGG